MRRKDGFTLIELIVVIAILGILALFLVPSFIGYAKDAKEAVCSSNLTSINRAYQTKLTKLGESENKDLLLNVMNNTGSEYFSAAPKCPDDGIYLIESYTTESGNTAYRVKCTVHSQSKSTIPVQIIDQINDLKTNSNKYEQYNNGKPIASWQLNNNDEIRKILKNANGGKWPELNVAGKSEPLYVMPYADLKDTDAHKASKDTYIYASNNQGSNWHVSYIYDQDEGAWYTAPSIKNSEIMIAFKSFADVKDEMAAKNWIKLDEKEYSINGEIILP